MFILQMADVEWTRACIGNSIYKNTSLTDNVIMTSG